MFPPDAPLQLYQSSTGYQIQKPAAWSSKQKAGAEVLFNDPEKASTTVGVTVSPVRITSLTAFGSQEDVAEKLLAAERKKARALRRHSNTPSAHHQHRKGNVWQRDSALPVKELCWLT